MVFASVAGDERRRHRFEDAIFSDKGVKEKSRDMHQNQSEERKAKEIMSPL